MSYDIVERYKQNPIITLIDIPFPCNTVFNAGATRYNDDYILLLRVEDLSGRSVFVLAKSHDGVHFSIQKDPVMSSSDEEPFRTYEKRGIEDPRITKIDKSEFDDPENVFVIPHGARDVQPVKEAKELLGLSGDKVILLAGYFRQTKGFLRIVRLFPEIAKRVPEATLVVASKKRLFGLDEDRDNFFNEINTSPAKDRIKVFHGQFPQNTFDTIISAAGVVPFPYMAGSQSGMMAQILAFNRPFIASNLESFKNIADKSVGGLVASNDMEYVDFICRILEDEEFAALLSGNIKEYVERHLSWDIIADKHIDVYHKVLRAPLNHAEYICQIEPQKIT
ncbi:MAG: hypothetical protein SVM80_10395 [Halobacteriota archaeon]|nr:hypothetical protein [Halobacteriota archaeon]